MTPLVVVTGGGTGIGRAVAASFAREGTVVIMGRRRDVLAAAAAEMGPSCHFVPGDAASVADVERLATRVAELGEHVDVVVNAAGFAESVTTTQPLRSAHATWERVLAGNVTSAFLVSAALAPRLRRPGGRIVNVSSIAAFTGGSRAGSTAYAAAKAGVLGLTRGLARELAQEGITVNAVAPGFVAGTGFTGGWPSERIDAIVRETPAGRGGTPDDVVAVVRFLASPEASFVCGEVVDVNGGWRF